MKYLWIWGTEYWKDKFPRIIQQRTDAWSWFVFQPFPFSFSSFFLLIKWGLCVSWDASVLWPSKCFKLVPYTSCICQTLTYLLTEVIEDQNPCWNIRQWDLLYESIPSLFKYIAKQGSYYACENLLILYRLKHTNC